MIRTVILGGVLLGLALPAVARAGDDPTSTDREDVPLVVELRDGGP